MKAKPTKIIIRFAVALCTFVVGYAVFVLVSEFRGPLSPGVSVEPVEVDRGCDGRTYSSSLSISDQPPILDYCEIANHPECYSGKLVLMNANLSNDDHGIFLYGDGCEARRTAGQLTGMSSDEYEEVWREACGKRCPVDLKVLVLGRFEQVIPTYATNLNWDTMQMHLELLRVGQASKSR